MDNSNNAGLNEELMSSCSLKQDKEVAVVMVPVPLQSHLTQLLQLSCLISSYGLPVYYVGLATYNHQVRVRANALNSSDIAKIHFHDLPITPHDNDFSITSPPVPSSSDIPVYLQPLWNACTLPRESVASFLRDISSQARRVVVIHDTLMSYNVQDVSSLDNAESYMFNPFSCFDTYSQICQATGLPIPLEEQQFKRLPSSEGCYTDDILHLGIFQFQYVGIKAGDIYNTSKVIEGTTFIDLMAETASAQNKKLWAIGPILPTKVLDRNMSYNKKNDCLDWLNKQPPNSVLYVSFGTSTSFSNEQIKELAMGLEQSKQKFIWVLRDADKGGLVFTDEGRRTLELPEGFEERVKGVQGLVIREWAPQPEILAHPSTGGFLSHCGWNSCLESITMGVPIAAWPTHFDQPKNGFLVTEILKIGLTVREWKKREELVNASTIENVVRKLIASEEGDAIRKRAQQLGEAVRQSVEKGGASRVEFDSFIAHIKR